MSGLTELLARLMEKARTPGALEAVGEVFNRGAALPGTFQKGRALAETPEGLAAQFDWGLPKVVSDGWKPVYGFPEPGGGGRMAVLHTMGRPELEKYFLEELGGRAEDNGIAPFLPKGALPADARFHMYDTQPLEYNGAGRKAYPVLYGTTLNDPGAYNIKGELSGSNAHRNNYNLASMIMRRPDAGERLLTSPEQFQMLGVNPVRLRLAGPDEQVGTLQTEGALQLLRRLSTESQKYAGGPHKQFLEDLPRRTTSRMSPENADYFAAQLRALYDPRNPPLRTVGPGALRKLGIVQDALNDASVSPAAFRGLEYAGGGRVGGLAQTCGCGAAGTSLR